MNKIYKRLIKKSNTYIYKFKIPVNLNFININKKIFDDLSFSIKEFHKKYKKYIVFEDSIDISLSIPKSLFNSFINNINLNYIFSKSINDIFDNFSNYVIDYINSFGSSQDKNKFDDVKINIRGNNSDMNVYYEIVSDKEISKEELNYLKNEIDDHIDSQLNYAGGQGCELYINDEENSYINLYFEKSINI